MSKTHFISYNHKMHKLVQCYWRSNFISTEVIQWLRCMFCIVWWILYIPDELTCRDFKSTVTITTDWTGFIYCVSRIPICIDRNKVFPFPLSICLSIYSPFPIYSLFNVTLPPLHLFFVSSLPAFLSSPCPASGFFLAQALTFSAEGVWSVFQRITLNAVTRGRVN